MVFYPWYGITKNYCYYSEFNGDTFVKVLYTKKDKFTTKMANVQDTILRQPQKLYTGMPVMPLTNSRSDPNLILILY
jgi:hypothetical protein